MTSDVEPANKILLPYLQRADELQKHEPLIAYYCRLYAMERGLKIPIKERTKTTNAILVSLMNQLEKDKKTVKVSPDDNLHVEGFALNVFAKADKQDRAGRADLNTAKTFYAAAIFMDVLNQFGPLQPDIEQKQKYAIWKAADIRKALSEGRKPVPGPPGGDETLPVSPSASDPEMDEPPKEPGTTTAQPPHSNNLQRFSSMNSSNSMDVDEGPKVDSNHGTSNDSYEQYSMNKQYGMPQTPYEPPSSRNSGYPSAYPSSYYPSPAAPDVPSTRVTGQYGNTNQPDSYNGQSHLQPDSYNGQSHLQPDAYNGQSHLQPDAYNGQSHLGHYDDYTQSPTTGFTYPSTNQTPYAPNNCTLDTSYYQAQGGQIPGALTYSATTPSPTTDHYSSVPASAPPPTTDHSYRASVSSVRSQHYKPSPEKITDAQKAARFAVSSLAFDDVPTAVQYLEEALAMLTRPS